MYIIKCKIQALVAMNEVSKEIQQGNRDFFPIKPTEYGRFLVISLGTGSPKSEEKYNANEAAKWGILGWLSTHNSNPLVDIFTQASGDLIDFHLSTVFQALHSDKHYLRIQVYLLLLFISLYLPVHFDVIASVLFLTITDHQFTLIYLFMYAFLL